MKSVCLISTSTNGGKFEIREIQKPVPASGELLIKVECFGVNYADVMAGHGLYQDCPPLPAVLGYESVGIVEEAFSNEDKHWVGKKVIAFTRFGSNSEYVIAKNIAIVELPTNIRTEDALALATQYSTAWYAACETVNLHTGDKVLIHAAAGGVGTALTQICKWKGCTVIALIGNDEKIDYAKLNGADHVINYKKTDYEEQVKRLFPEGIDVAFNAVAGKTFKKDRRLLSTGGRIVLYGASERMKGKFGIISSLSFLFNVGFFSPVFLMMKTQAIIGFNMLKIGDEKPEVLRRCMTNVVKLSADGILKPHTSKMFPASETEQAHRFLASGKSVGKIGISW